MSIAAHRFDNSKRRRPEHHPNQRQLTPGYVLEPIRSLLGGIDLDPCTEPDNPTGAARFYTPPQDGAAEPWDAATIYCNPPYGEARARWVRRCIAASKEGSKVVLLMPASTETQLFHEAAKAAISLVLVKARLRFGLVRKKRTTGSRQSRQCNIRLWYRCCPSGRTRHSAATARHAVNFS